MVLYNQVIFGGVCVGNVFTIANGITALRLILSIPIFYMLWHNASPWAVFALFVVAALTDFLDGYIARRRNEISNVGKLLDPVADKVLVVGTLIAITLRGDIPVLWVILLGLKEIAMLLGGAILLERAKRIVAARFLGKAATVVLVVGIVLALLQVTDVARPIIGAGVVVSLAAGLDYFLLLFRKQD